MALSSLTKSDNLIYMKRVMTATEVARNFSEVLDQVVAGDQIVITRGNVEIVVMNSASSQEPNSKLLAKSLDEHFAKYGPISQKEAKRKLDRLNEMRELDMMLEAEKWNR
ncbi:type II toxin-antitoxin system Phd/YefM family antitoxin [Aquiluna borgnonia]|nr:type II toxin-antitoxin system prevent-host-death family antitoxin [Aquiluna borgnonia]